jgi:hypothetical protein
VKPTVEQIGNLLALKRDERPEEGYWQDFLCEFHHNQREQVVKNSGFVGFFRSFAGRWSYMGSSIGGQGGRWLYGAGIAYAAVTVAFLVMPREAPKMNQPATPASFQVVPPPAPPPVEQLNQLDLSPSTQGSVGEQVF